MSDNAIKLFHELMKKGWIDRSSNVQTWNMTDDEVARDELDKMGEELGFEIIQTQKRLYLVPTQENDLFLKNNMDYRSDISASNDVRVRDLYLLNYLAVYILYTFFRGENNNESVIDFITKEELIKEFTEHCNTVTQKGIEEEDKSEDFSDNFIALANDWLGKKEGKAESKKMEDRYGVVNKILMKFKKDDLFDERGNRIFPTQKTKDLMPYVLRKDRVTMINEWMEEKKNATDNKN